ncbi:MAG: hypothetical protein KatS3mg111_1508 [Pirellulaceae bacterium]|nr:MAG: hypothetical protein KatS3mg111_1508 [Pirellulaceae bacterium]
MDAKNRAEFQTGYLMRYALMAAVGISFSLWFLYDGVIGYPRQLPKARAYDALRDLATEERLERWEQVAKENGWSTKPPEKTAEEIESDIVGQYVFAAVFAVLGIPALYLLITSRGTWVEETDEGIRTSWGQEVPFAAVERLDKTKWAKKGIAKAYYMTPQGTKSFVFDDFKYDRQAIGQMLRRLESQLPRDRIVGGPTEEETDAQRQASAVGEAGEATDTPADAAQRH